MTGIAVDRGALTTVGCFPAKVVFVTRALAYSGSEMSYPQASVPMPICRITFFLDRIFDFSKVEFHFKNRVYLPCWPGFETGNGGVVYSCYLQEPEGTAVV